MGNMFSVLQTMRHTTAPYQPGTTVLTYEEELSVSPDQRTPLQSLLGCPGDTEGSSNSEGSHATGDSGRYSHDETEMATLLSGASSRPPSPAAQDSSGSDCSDAPEEPHELSEDSQVDLKLKEAEEKSCCHHEAQGACQSALSLCV